ncbi:MAG: TIGR03546 family protein [Pirellulales bacterium]|nr:TIGR03546 family protein [Pirellulales bacterium]
MVIWTIKLFKSARGAIAGRKHPHQLAWAVAFGLLLGIVPHGNLLALLLLVLVLSLKLNHAMAGLTAVGATFAGTLLDPYSHRLGDAVLTHPKFSQMAANAWQLPLMPWTDLNNTVVMGSFVIGVAALVPVFALTYPLFRALAPKVLDSKALDSKALAPKATSKLAAAESPDESADDDARPTHEIVVVNQGHKQIAKPHLPGQSDQPSRQGGETRPNDSDSAGKPNSTTGQAANDVQPSSDSKADADSELAAQADAGEVAVETRIDVIRMQDFRDSGTAPNETSTAPNEDKPSSPEPMDEALSYLLRQLRDSQQRKVA